MAERVVPRRGLALRAYAGRTAVPFGGFGNTSAGSVVEWNIPENLITGASVAGTT
jgi:hypothetical protein